MTFDSPEEMLSFIRAGHDLYDARHEIYVFDYNESGSICCYDGITTTEAIELLLKDKDREGWSGFLGTGGHILDSEEYCKENGVVYKGDDVFSCKAWCSSFYDWIVINPKEGK